MNQDVNHVDGFAQAIEREIAAIAAEQQRASEAKALEEERRDKACRAALRVHDEVIVPLLNGVRDAFAKATLLQCWEVNSEGKMDAFSATCRTCSVNPEDPSFQIKADAAVQDKAGNVRFSVVCEWTGPPQPPAPPVMDLHRSEDYSMNATEFDMTVVRRWFYRELEESVVACVRQRRNLLI